MIRGMSVTPGSGVDFGHLGTLLGLAGLVYLLGAMLNWAQGYVMAGVAQRTVYRMREDVESKLARLPLRYFDRHSHGDILSRVTNDIDNVTTTLQQGLSQLLSSGLTILGVIAMMFWISPLAGRRLAHNHPALARRDVVRRAALPGAVRRPVGAHRER